jgi:hypothetical protein
MPVDDPTERSRVPSCAALGRMTLHLEGRGDLAQRKALSAKLRDAGEGGLLRGLREECLASARYPKAGEP